MPYVSKLDCDHNRNNPNPIISFPTNCPICGSNLVTSDSGKTAICPNDECPGRSTQRMVNMFAKLGIKGFADAAFVALGKSHLYELVDIVNLGYDEIRKYLGESDSAEFYNSMKALMTQPLKDYIVMGALGFTSMAHKKWKSILEKIRLQDLYNLYLRETSEEGFITDLRSIIPDIGKITSYTIAKEFPFFEKDIITIISWGNLIDSYGTSNTSKLEIRFTGVRNKQLSELLINAGYDADDSSSVTKKTDILLVPYEGFSSSKVNKAGENCKIIPIDEFINNMNKYIGEKLM
jgi:NAD-dependent DNA ligase